MKFQFTGLFLLLCSSIIFAQTHAVNNKAKILSGTGSITSYGGNLYEHSKGDRYTTMSFSPSLLYFTKPNLAFGLGMTYENRLTESNDLHSVQIGPSIGYFWGDENSNNYPFLLTSVHFYYADEYGDSVFGRDIILSGGYIFPLRKHLGLVVQLNYHAIGLTFDDGNNFINGNILSLGVGLAGLIF